MAKKKSKGEDAEKQLLSLALPVQEALNADLVVLGGAVYPYASLKLTGDIRDKHKAPNVLFMVMTFGGLADPAYRIARCLRQKYGSVTLFVDSYCKSAGTLFAIGADEIVMSEMAELGPLDAQMRKADELDERISGLTPMQALSTLRAEAYVTFEEFLKELRKNTRISTRLAAELAEKLTVGLFSPIYSQMEPMRLGENERGMLIAKEYGRRLSQHTENLRANSIDRLMSDYPSHEFIIDREEAKELFIDVREPTDDEQALANAVTKIASEYVFDEDTKGPFLAFYPFSPTPPNPKTDESHDTELQTSTDQGHGATAETSASPNGEHVEGNGQSSNGMQPTGSGTQHTSD